MGFNVAIDMLFGAVPLLGDLFDFAWRANRKNVLLVLDQQEKDTEIVALIDRGQEHVKPWEIVPSRTNPTENQGKQCSGPDATVRRTWAWLTPKL